jgi:hypothetical protein
MVDDMDKETTDIKTEALRMCWYMRGGLSYDQAMLLGVSERKIISQLINDNMETTKKTGLNFF